MVRFFDDFHVFRLTERMTLFRGSFGDDETSVMAALMSNYEARREPPHPLDLHMTALHMAISAFDNQDPIVRLAKRRPDRVGSHVLRLELEPGRGVCLADTSAPGHWSVWATPDQLRKFVADVTKV